MEGIDREAAIALWEATERSLHARGAAYEKDPATMAVEPFRIFGRLFYVGDRVVCAHLLDSGEGLILFDSGFPHASARLLGAVSALGFPPSGIKYVIHSHEHYDHFGATRFLQTQYGARTFLHRLGAETFRLYPHHTELQSANCPEASLFLPDVELEEGDRIRLGDVEIACAHTPGHSAGSCTYFFRLRDGGRSVRVGLCGINGNIPLHPGRLLKYGIPLSSGERYLASIARMMQEEVDLALDTHPRPKGIVERRLAGASDFVDPAAWKANLQDYEARYAAMMDDFEARLRGPRREGP